MISADAAVIAQAVAVLPVTARSSRAPADVGSAGRAVDLPAPVVVTGCIDCTNQLEHLQGEEFARGRANVAAAALCLERESEARREARGDLIADRDDWYDLVTAAAHRTGGGTGADGELDRAAA